MMQEIAEKRWSVKQLKFVEIKADPTDDRTIEEIAAAIKVSERTLYGWQKLPGFWEAVYGLARNTLKSRLPRILNAIADKAIQKKDVNAAKLCLEACGMVNSKIHVDLNHQGKVEHEYINKSEVVKRVNEYDSIFDKIVEGERAQEAAQVDAGGNGHKQSVDTK